MAAKSTTPTVAERLAALAVSAAEARKAQAQSTLEPIAALVSQAEALTLGETVEVIKALLPLMDDSHEKTGLAQGVLILPGMPGILRNALAQAQKIADA